MSSPKPKFEMCERCNQRPGSVSAGTGFKDGKLVFRHLCRECFEIEQASGPQSLQELINKLEDKEKSK